MKQLLEFRHCSLAGAAVKVNFEIARILSKLSEC